MSDAPPPMTFPSCATLLGGAAVSADVCIVGAGAGGSMVARELARAGLDVVVLEEGPDMPPRAMSQLEDEMVSVLYQRGGGWTTAERAITLLAGRGLGGSTLHNLNLCKRAPRVLLDGWVARGLDAAAVDLDAHYAAVETDLSVAPIPDRMFNTNNALFRAGVEALGYRGARLSHNRTDCIGAGFCELGCSFDRKHNARKILLPEAARAGARIFAGARVDRVVLDAGKVTGVEVTAVDRYGVPVGALSVQAPTVCLAAGAVGSAALALRSGVPDPHGQVGRGVRIHPGSFVVGVFPELVEAWRGIPQAWECTELLDPAPGSERRVWLLPGSAHPISAAAMVPGSGAEHRRWVLRFPNLGASIAMVHDEAAGTVTLDGAGRPRLDYVMNQGDREQMALGLRALAQIHLAAGATEVLLPFAPQRVVRSEADLAAVTVERVVSHRLPLVGVHLQGGMAMARDPSAGATDARGAVFGVPGLFVGDGGLFPTSLGVPPQLTIYASARRVAAAMLDSLPAGS